MIKIILEKFEFERNGIKYLYFPARNPKKLVVSFNGATRNKYSMWSFFYNESHSWEDTSYLFLKDDSDPNYFWWYLKDSEYFSDIIEYHIQKLNLTSKAVIMLGSSMGGYACIYYGLKFGVRGCISFSPQIDYLTASKFFTVARLKDIYVDLNDLIKSVPDDELPMMYLNYSDFPHDKLAAYHLIDEMKKSKTLSLIHPTSGSEHCSWNPDEKFVRSLLELMYSIDIAQR